MIEPRSIGEVEHELSLRETGTSLAWLADAPLFIDKDQIAGFYDAVVRPEGHHGKTVISLERFKGQTTQLEGAVEGEVSVSKLITTLLPFLDVKAKAKVGGWRSWASSEKRGETIEFYPIETPQRQLVQLTLHYLANLPKRLKLVTDPMKPGWCDQEFIDELPRALVFLDFPRGTMFIPMAAEVDKGRVVTIFNLLNAKGEAPPDYRDAKSFVTQEEYEVDLRKYWGWFKENFSPKIALGAVENVIADGGEGGRIQWIDYRVPLADQRPIHLHICGRGLFDTGTFAYNLIKRGFKHGLRIVGTLKSEPDLNVLAIFEK